MKNFGRKHRFGITAGIIAILSLSLFAYLTYIAIERIGKVKVEFSIAPSGSELLINNKRREPGTIYLEPGDYTILVRKEGFQTYTRKQKISDTNEPIILPISLTPKSLEALGEMTKKNNEYLTNEGIAGKRAQAFGKKFREKNTIVSKLPHRTSFYTIGYQNDSGDPSGMTIIVTIDADEGNRSKAIAQIERWGYDTTSMKILFRGYTNPFDEMTEGDPHEH